MPRCPGLVPGCLRPVPHIPTRRRRGPWRRHRGPLRRHRCLLPWPMPGCPWLEPGCPWHEPWCPGRPGRAGGRRHYPPKEDSGHPWKYEQQTCFSSEHAGHVICTPGCARVRAWVREGPSLGARGPVARCARARAWAREGTCLCARRAVPGRGREGTCLGARRAVPGRLSGRAWACEGSCLGERGPVPGRARVRAWVPMTQFIIF